MTPYNRTTGKPGPAAARLPHLRRAAVFTALSLFVLATGLLCPHPVSAQTLTKEKEGTVAVNDRVTIEMYGGYLKGESREYVYNAASGHKISQLNWIIDDAYVVGGSVSVRANDWLTLRLGGWTPLKSHNTMNDYDWERTGHGDWSDLSHHSDTRINHAVMIDAGAKARIANFGKTSFYDRASLDFLAGFRFLNISWTSYGGSGTYSTSGGYRNSAVDFEEGQAGLAYEQWFNTPYIGVGGGITKGRFTFATELTGSLWGWGSDKDNHYNRTLLFEEQYSRINMASADFSLACALSKNVDLVSRFVYTKYYESQTSSTMQNYGTGTTEYASGNAAGMDHQNMLVSLGIRWRIF